MANTPTSKVIFGTETLIDLTEDTAEAGDVLLGKSFHLPSGAQGTGTLNPALKEDIAGVESSSIASVAHASGTYLYYNNVLYKATDDIAQGDSIVTSGASQNVELVTVGGELVTLNNSLANKELRFTDVAVSATTGNIISISGVEGEKITASHVLDWVRFSNPSAITVMNSWTTANGSFVINGTCVAANVTADIKLARVD